MASTIEHNRRAQRERKKVTTQVNSDSKVHSPKGIAGGHKIFPEDNVRVEDEVFELERRRIDSEIPTKQDSLESLESPKVIKILLTCEE